MAPLLKAILLTCSAAGAVNSPMAAMEEEGLLSAMVVGDECASATEADACSVSALQRRGEVLQHSSSKLAEEGSSEEAAAKSKAMSAAFEARARAAGWARESRCQGHEIHELGFVVQQSAAEELKAMALDRSDPSSPNWRQWLPWKEVVRRSRNDQSLGELRRALAAQDVSVQETPGGELVRARAPISTWEALLSMEFHVYRHEDDGSTVMRTPSYLLPRHMDGHVQGILNAVDLDVIRFGGVSGVDLNLHPEQGSGWGFPTYEQLYEFWGRSVISPEKLRKAYQVPPIAPRLSKLAEQRANTSQVVFATVGQHWSPSDRSMFEVAFGIPTDNYVRQLDTGNGYAGETICRVNAGKCAEANLDVQYMMAMSPWAKMGYWYEPKANANGLYHFLMDFHKHFIETDEPPHVISISYGMPEFAVSDASMTLFETMAMKLALAGVTIVAASGDDGAASFLARRRSHGEWCWSVPKLGLQVSFPANSLWVTGVGASLGAGLGIEPEIACQINATGPAAETNATLQITSGGGFSQALKRPEWQDGHHNEVGRGVPDVSVVGHAYAVVIGQSWGTADGTSAGTPVFGGMLSLINAELVSQGSPTLGFLNPLLYSNKTVATIFRDITQGDNRCGAIGYQCCGGYDAGEGWDPVTGLGTPNWKKLREAIFKFPELLAAPEDAPSNTEIDREEMVAKDALEANLRMSENTAAYANEGPPEAVAASPTL